MTAPELISVLRLWWQGQGQKRGWETDYSQPPVHKSGIFCGFAACKRI